MKTPGETKVRLIWSGPKVDMEKQQDGFRTITTAPLVPGFHYYTLIIDGPEVSDPNTHAFFGGGKLACGVEVPELGSVYYSTRCAAWCGSRGLVQLEGDGSWQHALVYLPPDYDTKTNA